MVPVPVASTAATGTTQPRRAPGRTALSPADARRVHGTSRGGRATLPARDIDVKAQINWHLAKEILVTILEFDFVLHRKIEIGRGNHFGRRRRWDLRQTFLAQSV